VLVKGDGAGHAGEVVQIEVEALCNVGGIQGSRCGESVNRHLHRIIAMGGEDVRAPAEALPIALDKALHGLGARRHVVDRQRKCHALCGHACPLEYVAHVDRRGGALHAVEALALEMTEHVQDAIRVADDVHGVGLVDVQCVHRELAPVLDPEMDRRPDGALESELEVLAKPGLHLTGQGRVVAVHQQPAHPEVLVQVTGRGPAFDPVTRVHAVQVWASAAQVRDRRRRRQAHHPRLVEYRHQGRRLVRGHAAQDQAHTGFLHETPKAGNRTRRVRARVHTQGLEPGREQGPLSGVADRQLDPAVDSVAIRLRMAGERPQHAHPGLLDTPDQRHHHDDGNHETSRSHGSLPRMCCFHCTAQRKRIRSASGAEGFMPLPVPRGRRSLSAAHTIIESE